MIELYTHPMSPCAQKVRIVLAEKGLEWSSRHVDLANKDNLRPEYLHLNPQGVVPTLVHDRHVVIESSIICEYLDDNWPDPPLVPAAPFERAHMRLWMKHVDNKLHPACGALQWPLIMRPALMEKSADERNELLDRIPDKARRERQRRLVQYGLDAPDFAEAVRTYRATIVDMDKLLRSGSWMAGDHFSLADASLIPYFQTLAQFGWAELFETKCPAVTSWVARCMGRPSYESAVSVDFSKAVQVDLRARGASAVEKIAALLVVEK